MTVSNICSGCGNPVAVVSPNCTSCGAKNYAFIDLSKPAKTHSAPPRREEIENEPEPEKGPFVKFCRHCKTKLSLVSQVCTYCGNKGDWLQVISEGRYNQSFAVSNLMGSSTQKRLSIRNCIECGTLLSKGATGVWVTDPSLQKRILCQRCRNTPEIWARYAKDADKWKEHEKIHLKAARKTKNFIIGVIIAIIVLIVVVNVVAYLMHSGSCIGPDGDYSNCYP